MRIDFTWARRSGGTVVVPVVAGWILVLLAAVLAYWPGLDGPFLLDDLGSIAALGDYGGVVDWESFKLFVFGGAAGPTGRPVALLSFLLDGNTWPTDAWPFKRTNLVIHLVNGVLLGVLVTRILKCLDFKDRDIRWIALVTAAIWVLHPFLVSTTLYVVQRMAQLATTFMFAGLALYLHGRSLLATNPTKAYVVMSSAVAGFTLLAMLAKENGVLLPVLVGVVELTVIASQRDRLPALRRYWTIAFVLMPTIVIFAYLGKLVMRDDFFEIIPFRDFSIYERLLTQGRILVDYLQHWYLPKLYTTGVFQDHFIKSTSLFSPLTTALSIALHVALLALAFWRRRQWPLFSLAVLFFYANHLLESTVVNLELYFEHRNYGAAAFLFLPLVEIAHRKLGLRRFAIAAFAALLLVGSFTRYSATVWESLPSMIESSALKAPTSPRAQSQYAKLLFFVDRHDEAVATIDAAMANIPRDDQLLLANRLFFLCNANALSVDDFHQAAAKLAALPFDSRALKAYNEFSREILTGSCPNIAPEWLEATYIRMLEHPANADPTSLPYSHVQFLLGYARTYMERPGEALEAFERSLDSRPGPSHAMAMAAQLATRGYNREALVLAERALARLREEMAADPRRIHKVKVADIEAFQATVSADLAKQQGDGTSGRVD